VNYEKLTTTRLGEPSAAIRARVQVARDRQGRRFPLAHAHSNADMGPAELRAHCQLDGAGQALMKAAVRQLNLSAHGYHALFADQPDVFVAGDLLWYTVRGRSDIRPARFSTSHTRY